MLVTPLSLTKHTSQKNVLLGLIYLYSTEHPAFEGSLTSELVLMAVTFLVWSYCAAKGIQEHHPEEGQETA